MVTDPDVGHEAPWNPVVTGVISTPVAPGGMIGL
jgi:hypothetical protein